MKGTSIGIEIEVNHLPFDLRNSIDWSLWGRDAEHCGIELRSIPFRGFSGIRAMRKSLQAIEKSPSAKYAGFNNAGTHIHIDFAGPESAPPLKRKAAKAIIGGYDSPSGKKWYWVSPDGAVWASPSDYRIHRGSAPSEQYNKTGDKLLLSVQRFFAIGIRFADTLFALQHPDRRVNKYCHSIENWDEKTLFSARSIAEIAEHPQLQQMHRRHMFNAMAYKRWGTIEVRMIRATLDSDELWAQICLFSKLAAAAKDLERGIPEAKGNISVNFVSLLNFANINGKNRKVLTNMFNRNSSQSEFYCRCFRCHSYLIQQNFVDIGMSRVVCRGCFELCCENCSRYIGHADASANLKVDNLVEGGRYVCGDCSKTKDNYANSYERRGFHTVAGMRLGSGFDKFGMRQLRRMRELFA